MNEVVKFLNENPVQYLATVGRDGKAKCRPFMFAGEQDGKLWFCTNNQKDVSRICRPTLKWRSPCPSPYLCLDSSEWKQSLRTTWPSGECIQNPIVMGQYQTADNPTSRCSI